MPTEINVSRGQSSSVGNTGLPANPDAHDMKNAILHALKTDNWAAFHELVLRDGGDSDMAARRYDHGQNCLHVAIKAGSNDIASKLAAYAYEHNIDLINVPDDAGDMPIMVAAKCPTDAPKLIDTLIKHGATRGLSEALAFAAEAGHTEATRHLIHDSDADASEALAQILRRHNNAFGLKAAQFLISLGGDVTQALDHATDMSWLSIAQKMIFLGANASNVLASTATLHTITPETVAVNLNTAIAKLKVLLLAGADVTTALVSLAKKPRSEANSRAISLLIMSEQKMIELHAADKPPSDRAALARLAKSRDIPALRVLSECVAPENLGCHELANRGDVDALKVLIETHRLAPQDLLMNVALAHRFGAAKTLIRTGMQTANLLNDLLKQSGPSTLPETMKVIALLVAAGADPSMLPKETRDELSHRQIAISTLSSHKKDAALLAAAISRNIADAAILLDHGASGVSALKSLINARHPEGIRTLIDAGAVTPDMLIERIKAGDMAVAQLLSQEKQVATQALINLIEKGDHETARAFIPELTDGKDALIQAVQANDKDLAHALIAMHADMHEALRALLAMKEIEAASRLVAAGADIHTTLMHAYRLDDIPAQVNLLRLGANVALAATQALELGEAETAYRIFTQNSPLDQEHIIAHLIDSDMRPNAAHANLLTSLLETEIHTDRILEKLANDNDIVRLRALVAAGAPTVELLIDLCQQGNRSAVQALIEAGADAAEAMAQLQEDKAQDAVNLLAISMVWQLWGRNQPEPSESSATQARARSTP